MSIFVGRESETDVLRRLAAEALRGAGRIAFITGTPGIGKTTFVDQLIQNLDPESMLILRGFCSEQFGMGEAYLPFKQVLAELIGSAQKKSQRQEYLSLLQEIAPNWIQLIPLAGSVIAAGMSTHAALQRRKAAPEEEVTSRERMLSEYADVLYMASRRRPVLIFLEDLHWADPSSVDVLSYLARNIRKHPLLLVGTYRDQEVDATHHPLRRIAFDLEGTGVAHTIALGPLGERQFEEYLSAAYPGHRFSAEFRRFIFEKTGGHPLFLREFFSYLEERGIITSTAEGWELVASFDLLDIPRRVESMVRRSLEMLNSEDRRLLGYASVEGEAFTTDVLAALLEEDDFVLDERMKRIEASTHIVSYDTDLEYPNGELGSRFRFTHALYQNTLYQDLTAKQRVVLHRKVAVRLAELYKGWTEMVTVQIAVHFDRGRDFGSAAEWHARAAAAAVAQLAFHEAAAHYRRARECLEMVRSGAIEEIGPLMDAEAEVHIFLADYISARTLYAELEKRADSAGSPRWRAHAHYGYAVVNYELHRLDDSLQAAEQGSELARASADEIIELRCLSAIRSVKQALGEVDEATALTAKLILAARSRGDHAALAENLFYGGLDKHHRGDGQQAIEWLREGKERALEARSGLYLVEGATMYGLAQATVGDYRIGYEQLAEARALAERIGANNVWPRIPNMQGWIHHEFQDLPNALEFDREGLEHARSLVVEEAEANSLINLGDGAYAVHDKERALGYYGEALALMHGDAYFSWRYSTRLFCSLGTLWLHAGELEKAWTEAERALALARKTRAKKNIAKARLLQARIVAAGGNHGSIGGRLDPVALSATALRLARRVGNPPLLWKTLAFQGEILEKRGKGELARERFREAMAAADRMLEAAPLPALVETLRSSEAYQRLSATTRRLG